MSDSVQPHGLQPSRLLHPWDFQARVLEWGAIAFSGWNSRGSHKHNKKTNPIMKLCANRDTHEEFLSKIYKQLMHLNIKETTQSNRGTRFKWTFLQKRHRDGHEAHEKMLSIYQH